MYPYLRSHKQLSLTEYIIIATWSRINKNKGSKQSSSHCVARGALLYLDKLCTIKNIYSESDPLSDVMQKQQHSFVKGYIVLGKGLK